MSAYYPEGAAHLPWAPWNQDTDEDFDGLDEFDPDYWHDLARDEETTWTD